MKMTAIRGDAISKLQGQQFTAPEGGESRFILTRTGLELTERGLKRGVWGTEDVAIQTMLALPIGGTIEMMEKTWTRQK